MGPHFMESTPGKAKTKWVGAGTSALFHFLRRLLFSFPESESRMPAKSLQSCLTLQSLGLCSPLPMGFSRQEYWSGLSCPPPGDLSDPGVEPRSLMSPALAGGFFTTGHLGSPLIALVCLYQESCHVRTISAGGGLEKTGSSCTAGGNLN